MTGTTVRTSSPCTACGEATNLGDAFCGGCGSAVRPSPLPEPGTRRNDTTPSGAAGPDPAALRRLAETLVPTPAEATLSGPVGMCPACGTSLPDHTAGPSCPACGERSLVLPTSWCWAVGGVHSVRRGLRSRPALCVAADAGSLTLLLPDTSTMTVAPAHPTVEPPLPRHRLDGLRCSPGVLLAYATADRARCPWPPDAVIGTAVGLARHDHVLGRLTALDALTVGRADLVGHLGLPDAEAHWLGLVDAARRDDGEAIVAHVQALPPGRYRRAVGVLAARLPALRTVPHAGTRLAAFLRASVDEPLAPLIGRALGVLPATTATRWGDVDHRARHHPLPSPVREQVITLLAPELSASAPVRPDAMGPGARRLFARLHPSASSGLLTGDEIAALPPAEVDELIDGGALGIADDDALPPGPVRAHLRARLDPARLTDAELDAHPAEGERRRLLTGLASTSSDDPRLAALAAVRSGRWQDVDLDALDGADRDLVARLLAARERPADLLDDDLLADRTLWPAIEAHLAGDRTFLTDEARARFPEFNAWLDLQTAREHLFLARWDSAAAAARFCLRHSAREQVRDEALNLLACALHQQGDAHAAMGALHKAIEGAHSSALLANLGVVAGELEPQTAALHLARIVREAASPGLRRRAALRALRLWRNDPGFWEGDQNDAVLPPVLRAPLRSVVDEDMPLDDFRLLTAVLARKDAEWLRTSGALRRSPHARTWEARHAEATAVGSEALVALFASVRDWDAAPPWLVEDRDSFVTALWTDLVEDVDDSTKYSVDLCWTVARDVTGLDERRHLLIAHLAIAMVAGRAIERNAPVPDGLVDLWQKLRDEHVPVDPDDETLVWIEELATRRLANVVCVALDRRMQRAIAKYNEWLERLQRTVHYHNQAMDVFQNSVAELREVESELRHWRAVSPHAGTRELYDRNLKIASEAIPHISRMILPKLDFLS